MASKRKLVLVSSEGKSFNIEQSVAMQSKTISNMVGAGCVDDPIPLPNVTNKTLSKVIEFCVKHAEIQNPQYLKAWDAEFINVDVDTIFDLVLAANYLDIKSLLGLTTQAVADKIKGKSPEEIRRTFNIKSDFSAEEQRLIYEENKWAFE